MLSSLISRLRREVTAVASIPIGGGPAPAPEPSSAAAAPAALHRELGAAAERKGDAEAQATQATPATPTCGLALAALLKDQIESLRRRREEIASRADAATRGLAACESRARRSHDEWQAFASETARLGTVSSTVAALNAGAQSLLGRLEDLEAVLTAQTELAEQRARASYAQASAEDTDRHRRSCERRLATLRESLATSLARIRSESEAARRRREREAAAVEEGARRAAESAFARAVARDLGELARPKPTKSPTARHASTEESLRYEREHHEQHHEQHEHPGLMLATGSALDPGGYGVGGLTPVPTPVLGQQQTAQLAQLHDEVRAGAAAYAAAAAIAPASSPNPDVRRLLAS
eukprot:m51a1_g1997 hypothetical protein (353) ;mRNA; r:1214118-1215469